MRLKDYARNHKRRKEYVQQPGLLVVGVDVRKRGLTPFHCPLLRRDRKRAQAGEKGTLIH